VQLPAQGGPGRDGTFPDMESIGPVSLDLVASIVDVCLVLEEGGRLTIDKGEVAEVRARVVEAAGPDVPLGADAVGLPVDDEVDLMTKEITRGDLWFISEGMWPQWAYLWNGYLHLHTAVHFLALPEEFLGDVEARLDAFMAAPREQDLPAAASALRSGWGMTVRHVLG
jgi:hypothetical protein